MAIFKDLGDWNGVWNETSARDFCDKLINDSRNDLIQQCKLVTPAIREFCVQDIQVNSPPLSLSINVNL